MSMLFSSKSVYRPFGKGSSHRMSQASCLGNRVMFGHRERKFVLSCSVDCQSRQNIIIPTVTILNLQRIKLSGCLQSAFTM